MTLAEWSLNRNTREYMRHEEYHGWLENSNLIQIPNSQIEYVGTVLESKQTDVSVLVCKEKMLESPPKVTTYLHTLCYTNLTYSELLGMLKRATQSSA